MRGNWCAFIEAHIPSETEYDALMQYQLAQSNHTTEAASEHASGHATEAHTAESGHHTDLTYWQNMSAPAIIFNIAPFVALLLMIAILPLTSKLSHWWEHNRNKLMVAGTCGLIGIVLYVWPTHDLVKIFHTYVEYLAFMALLASLFIVSGGIHISGSFAGSPKVNTAFMAIGAVLANITGTTGASMLLIRPLIRANQHREHKTHIFIFFIFIVANCGGLLTPLGDPPLYLGFLRGVPFAWTLGLIKEWAFVIGVLLTIFYFLDSRMFKRETGEAREAIASQALEKVEGKKLHIEGTFNLGLLLGVVAVILASGYLVFPMLSQAVGHEMGDLGSKAFQIVAMALLALISFKRTPKHIHEENSFSFVPILEVACLFVGIFGAMIPALTLLEAKGASMAISVPWQYYWVSGGLSGFLDNAPTYVTFVTLAATKTGVSPDHLLELSLQQPHLLAAISCGAVMMGALSYIGNGPNFMVKAIAEHARIKMPSFGGYLVWSGMILVPVFILTTFLFFLK
jgi:Na+/H+ antiporter NhaD/arsenite permease-like protein